MDNMPNAAIITENKITLIRKPVLILLFKNVSASLSSIYAIIVMRPVFDPEARTAKTMKMHMPNRKSPLTSSLLEKYTSAEA